MRLLLVLMLLCGSANATWLYEADGFATAQSHGFYTGYKEVGSGPIKVSVELPDSYVPGNSFSGAIASVSGFFGLGIGGLDGQMPEKDGSGYLSNELAGYSYVFRAGTGGFFWTADGWCIDGDWDCTGTMVTGSLGDFRRIPEPAPLALLGALGVIALRRAPRSPGSTHAPVE